jgi:hypothetical protein
MNMKDDEVLGNCASREIERRRLFLDLEVYGDYWRKVMM